MSCIYGRKIKQLQKKIKTLEQSGGGAILNLATINGQSLLNGGDIDIQSSVIANEEFPSGWPKTGTMSSLVTAINNDTNVKKGKIYLSTVSYSDLPTNLGQAEMKVEIMDINEHGVIKVFTVTSEDRSPYHWERTSAYSRLSAWRSWLPSDTTIPDAQVQANWNETNTNSKAYIQNKPTIPSTTGMVTSSTTGLKIEVVASLPASPDTNTIYIVQ